MERTKLITIRLEKSNLEAIDALTSRLHYLNRSRVINALLQAVLYCTAGDGVSKLLECYDPVSDGAKIIVSFNSKL